MSLNDLRINDNEPETPQEILYNDIQTDINSEIVQAKERELQSWKSQKVYEEISDNGQSTISVRWVLKPKIIDGRMSTKARLCARGFEEIEKFQTDSPTCSRESVRIATSLIASFKWDLNSIDIKTAFLQGSKVNWEVIIKPPKEAATDKLWKLNTCVYRLGDAPRCWYLRLKDELIALNLSMSKYDPGFFYYIKDGKIIGLLVCFVDDLLWGGTVDFKQDVIDKLSKTFIIGSQFTKAFRYLGIDIQQNNNKSVTISQSNYAHSIKPIHLSKEQLTDKDLPITKDNLTAVRSLIGQLNWLACISRPDISFDVCTISTRIKNMKIKDIIELNKVVKRVQIEKNQIAFPTLDTSSMKLIVYTDASFNNLPNGGGQGGHIIFLADRNNNCCPLVWNSSRVKRVVRSTLAAETLALNEGCETAIYISRILQEIIRINSIPIFAITDNKLLHEVANSLTATTDRLLRVEIAAIREMCERKQTVLKWVEGKDQLSDSLTKKGPSSAHLLNVLKTGQL